MHNFASIADELWYKDLQEEDKDKLNRLFDLVENNYDSGYVTGKLEAALEEKKDTNILIDTIKTELNKDAPRVRIIAEAIKQFEDKIVA